MANVNIVDVLSQLGYERCPDKQGHAVFEAFAPGEFFFIGKNIRIGRSLNRSKIAPDELQRRLMRELRYNERRNTVILLPFAMHGVLDRLDAVRTFMQVAFDDGWEISNHGLEPFEHACHLEREGFGILALARPGLTQEEFNAQVAEIMAMTFGSPQRLERELTLKPKCVAELHCWGPDGLKINLPIEYPGIDYLRRALKHCIHCRRVGVKTERVFDTGRACGKCAQRIHKKMELLNAKTNSGEAAGEGSGRSQRDVVQSTSREIPVRLSDLDQLAIG